MSADPVLQPSFVPPLIAIAMVAFIAANIAHETVGHGAAFIALGDRSTVLTEAGGRIFSIGGPFGNLVCAAVAWLTQRALRGTHVRARVFLWLTMAIYLFTSSEESVAH